MLTLYFIALFLTIVIEITVAYILKWRDNKTWLAIILVNFITHPTLWYLLWILSRVFNDHQVNLIIILLEILIFITESFLLQFALKQKYHKMIILSLCMNLSSYLLGLLIMPYLTVLIFNFFYYERSSRHF